MAIAESAERVLESAAARADHMATAIAWFRNALTENEPFRFHFTTLVSALAEAETRRDEHTGPHALRQIHFVAVGKSGGVAMLAANMLNSVGVLARYLHPGEALHGDLGAVCEHDTVVCISNRGSTREILNILPMLRERACRLFAITADPLSPMAKACDYCLPLPPLEEACPIQQAPITSTVTSMALCQLLVAASVERRAFDVSHYARNHPGGSIGRRIYLRVADVMLRDDDLPLCSPDDSFQRCVSQLTRAAKSAVLVVNGDGRLLRGVVSERDIRVAMEEHGPGVFDKCVADFMNSHPLTIEPGVLAIDALKHMRERKNPLNFLPVVDAAGRLEGLLRLHELVAAGISVV